MATLSAPFAVHTRRILIADADTDTRAPYRIFFERLGWDVVEAVDGRDALARALTRVPSAVIIELHLPYVDGFALCEILRRDRATADVPILVITSDGSPASASRARSAGADVVLVKPTPIETVVSEVQRLIAASSGRTQDGAARTSEPRTARGRSALQARSKSFPRFTTLMPQRTPPALRCPSCGRPLQYAFSHVGGVNDRHAEQWDQFECSPCGAFEYRHRTGKLRRVSSQQSA